MDRWMDGQTDTPIIACGVCGLSITPDNKARFISVIGVALSLMRSGFNEVYTGKFRSDTTTDLYNNNIYMYIHTCMYMYMYMYTHVHVHVHTCTCTYVQCTCTYM